MNDALKMQISAFVDGELPENESELLLRRLSQDVELRQQVAAYLEIGRLIRQDRVVPQMDQLRGRISAALGDEQVQASVEQQVVGSGLMTPATGVAVAATVAALALVGLSQLGGPTDPDLTRAVAIDDGPAAYTEPAVDDVLANQPSQMLLQYYNSHTDSSGPLGTSVLMQRVRFEHGELVEIEPDPHLVPASDAGREEGESEQQ